jgi:hypothetical protein
MINVTWKTSTKSFWNKKGRVDKHQFKLVDWDSIGNVMRDVKIQSRYLIIKRVARFCDTNAMLYQQKQRPKDECPFLKEPETVLHVYKLPTQ